MICLNSIVYFSNAVAQGVATCMWVYLYRKIYGRRNDLLERVTALELWVTLNDKQMVRKWDMPKEDISPSDLAYMQERGML